MYIYTVQARGATWTCLGKSGSQVAVISHPFIFSVSNYPASPRPSSGSSLGCLAPKRAQPALEQVQAASES